MNETILSIITNMVQGAEQSANVPSQVKWETLTHDCSITVFHDADMEAEMKHESRFCNDVTWLGNVRFSATSK